MAGWFKIGRLETLESDKYTHGCFCLRFFKNVLLNTRHSTANIILVMLQILKLNLKCRRNQILNPLQCKYTSDARCQTKMYNRVRLRKNKNFFFFFLLLLNDFELSNCWSKVLNRCYSMSEKNKKIPFCTAILMICILLIRLRFQRAQITIRLHGKLCA